MIDFVELFNRVARVAKPAHPDFNNVKSMDDKSSTVSAESIASLSTRSLEKQA
jgi:hypothetical protein